MLLRRIKHHVVNENWFAVFVDFVIVVVGVYVGIEVSNWNEARQEDAYALEYLERVQDDLVQDRAAIVNRQRFWAQVIEYGEAAIIHAETDELYLDSVGKTLLAYFQASQVDPYASVKTTYDELKAAGELRLIRNADLRAGLTDYYVNSTSLQAKHLLQYIPAYREYIRGLIPYTLQDFVWVNCHGADDSGQILIDCDLPIAEHDGRTLLSEVTKNPTAVRQLRFWISNLTVANNVLDGNKVTVDTLLEIVDAELATH